MSPDRKVMFVTPSNVGKSVTSNSLIQQVLATANWVPGPRRKPKAGKKGVTYVRNRRTKLATVVRKRYDYATAMRKMFDSITADMSKLKDVQVNVLKNPDPENLVVKDIPGFGKMLIAKSPETDLCMDLLSGGQLKRPTRMDMIKMFREAFDGNRQYSRAEGLTPYVFPQPDLSDSIFDQVGIRGFVNKDGSLKIDGFNVIMPGA